MFSIRSLLLFFIVSLLTSFSVRGQLSADNAFVAQTEYSSTTPDDIVFCFPVASPMSVRFDYSGSSPSFSWFQHDVTNNSWDNPLTNTGNQLVAGSPGGYRVVVEDETGAVVADERFWVYNTQEITNLEAEITYDDCFGVEMSASADTVPLIFYDPADGSFGGVHYNLSFEWTTLPDGNESKSGRSVEFDAPFEDLAYVVTVSGRFGNVLESTLDYSAIAVSAEFEADVKKDTVLNERHSDAQGSAPIEIKFNNQSQGKVNAWEWSFGDSGQSVEQNPLFVFSAAGTDSVYLRVVNRDSGCESLSAPFVVSVWESELEVPNVFTPNGDGINDEFRVAYKSIKKFEMVVFNRWGRRVYEGNDPARGWDGKIGGTMGAPGVYFYNIRGVGYNDNEVHRKEGAVHLIRGK
ncbi:T9SS type B sorting domain-containing protein [Marinilabilia salmonicolor]|uniref:T9SS type B sorting domain-containing protein n=1 Tax=Marinilabilia salmonicolor TaxID=989 RepID=UPI00029A1DA2|nr:gliding motility-associated C-terminal domain-containing protein [Marinilabilia salmonicolor]